MISISAFQQYISLLEHQGAILLTWFKFTKMVYVVDNKLYPMFCVGCNYVFMP